MAAGYHTSSGELLWGSGIAEPYQSTELVAAESESVRPETAFIEAEPDKRHPFRHHGSFLRLVQETARTVRLRGEK